MLSEQEREQLLAAEAFGKSVSDFGVHGCWALGLVGILDIYKAFNVSDVAYILGMLCLLPAATTVMVCGFVIRHRALKKLGV